MSQLKEELEEQHAQVEELLSMGPAEGKEEEEGEEEAEDEEQEEEAAEQEEDEADEEEGDEEDDDDAGDSSDDDDDESGDEGEGEEGEGDGEEDGDEGVPDVNALLKENRELKEGLKTAEDATKAEVVKAETPVSFQEHEFFKVDEDEDMSQLLEDPSKLRAILNLVHKMSVNKAVEETMKRVPSMVAPEVTNQVAEKMAVDAFWGRNEALVEHDEFVAYTYNKLYSASPEKTVEALLKETETVVRKSLKLKGGGSKNGKVRPNRGGNVAPGTKSRKAVNPKRPKGIASEIADMDRV